MSRRADIDAVKGFAILLVVFGHLVARVGPQDEHWYEPARRAVYAFHMPLFLYLSGLVAVYSGAVLRPPAAWAGVVRARARRLLVPFFGVGLLVVGAKLLFRNVILVDNAPAGLASGLADLVWHTAASPALSVWYLFVLFVVSSTCLVFLAGRPARLPAFLAVLLLLYVLPLPEYVYADRVGTYGVFFGLGLAAGFAGARWDAFMDRWWPVLLAVLLVCLWAVALHGRFWPEKLTLLPIGALSMPAIHGWLRFWRANSARAILLFLGRASFMIYLFNTLFIGLAKGVLLHFWSWDGAHFAPFLGVLMAAGVLGPVGLKRVVFRRVGVLDRLTD
jgi:fucose 4-O-acetylase-like acetyltransferase